MKIDFKKVDIKVVLADYDIGLDATKEENAQKIKLNIASDVVQGEANVSINLDKKPE